LRFSRLKSAGKTGKKGGRSKMKFYNRQVLHDALRLDTRMISFAARQPVTDEEKIANRLGKMIDEGFEFEQEDRDEYVLLDTQNNRDKVDKILKSKFKSARIVEWHNHLIHEKNNFRLRDFIAYIGNLSELKELMMERSVSNNE